MNNQQYLQSRARAQVIPVSILAILILFSCSDDSINIDRSLLLGSWEPVELYTDDGKLTQTSTGIQVTARFEYSASDFTGVITFDENPDTFGSTISAEYEIVTTVAGQVETQQVEVESYLGAGTWMIDGDRIILDTGGDDPQSWKVLELTQTRLRMRMKEEFEGFGGGIRTESSATVYLTLER